MKLNAYNHQLVKMLSVEKFAKNKVKLKGFFTQIKIQINNERPRLPTLMEKVVYAGMSLMGKSLEWFQPYLAETQANGITSTNNKIRYMFLI